MRLNATLISSLRRESLVFYDGTGELVRPTTEAWLFVFMTTVSIVLWDSIEKPYTVRVKNLPLCGKTVNIRFRIFIIEVI